jgi:hypothetical protein
MAGRTDIPPEHSALKSLEHIFRAAGEEKERIRRLERRRTRRRAMLATVAVVATASGSVAIATNVLDNDDPPVRAGDAPGELARVPADRRPALATVADPVDRYGWGVRVYQGRTGDTCAVAGRVLRGRLGAIQNGRFRELPADVPGQCADLAVEHALVAVRSYAAGIGAARTVVYGVVDRTVTGIAIGRTSPGRQIPVAADGTFVYAVQGARAARGQRVFVTGADGVRSRTLAPAP